MKLFKKCFLIFLVTQLFFNYHTYALTLYPDDNNNIIYYFEDEETNNEQSYEGIEQEFIITTYGPYCPETGLDDLWDSTGGGCNTADGKKLFRDRNSSTEILVKDRKGNLIDTGCIASTHTIYKPGATPIIDINDKQGRKIIIPGYNDNKPTGVYDHFGAPCNLGGVRSAPTLPNRIDIAFGSRQAQQRWYKYINENQLGANYKDPTCSGNNGIKVKCKIVGPGFGNDKSLNNEVPCIIQDERKHCGRASGAMVVAYHTNVYYKTDDFETLSLSNINNKLKYHGSNVVYSLSQKNPKDDNWQKIMNSLKNKHPVVVFTNFYGGHIFVLTGYDANSGKFIANNPLRHACQKSVTKINGIDLTKENLGEYITMYPTKQSKYEACYYYVP